MEKEAFEYSQTCKQVKIIPYTILINKPCITSFLPFTLVIALWAKVPEIPEDISTTVFKAGRPQGLIAFIQ